MTLSYFIVVLLISAGMSKVQAQNNPLVGQSIIAAGSLATSQSRCNGRHIDVVGTWIDFGTNLSAVDITTPLNNGSILEITIQPKGKSPLADINKGTWDSYLHQLGADLKNFGHEIWIRPMQEVNGDFMEWSPGKNGQTAQDFIDAFRRIYTIIKVEEGATNVKIEYNVNLNSGNGNTFMSQYPGDDYCEFVGMDGYNWGTAAVGWTSKWQEFDQIFHDAYTAIKATGKKVIISEWGSGEAGGNKAQWITNSFNTVRHSGKYDMVYAMVYFDVGGYTPDYQINTSIASRNAYNKAIDFYTSDGLFNWSIQKAAASSSDDVGSSAPLAFDGNPVTSWNSSYNNNQWISVDLVQKVPIKEIVLNWGEHFGSAYQIEVSDDNSTWTTIFTETNGDGRIDDIHNINVSAKFVRMVGTGMATANGFALNEMEIYSLQKPLIGALKDKNGATLRGTPMVLGKALNQSVAFAQNIENWKTIQNNGYNTIRVCWVDPWYKNHSQDSWKVTEVLPYLDQCVQNATTTGMNLIINFHNVGAQQEFDKTYQFTLENEFWNAVAPRYKDNDLVYYEPANEPTFNMGDYLKADFKTSYLNLYNTIRTLAPDRQILLFSFNTIAADIVSIVENYKNQIDWTHTTVAYHMYNSTSSASIKTLMAYHPAICSEWFYDHVSKLPGNEFIKQVDGFKENAQTLEKIGSGWVDWRDWDDITLNELVDTLISDARVKNYWWGKPVPGLKAKGISLSDRNIQLIMGKSKKLIAFPLPAQAEDQKILWTTSNVSAVTVDANGLVTSVSSKNATAVITAKTHDGGFSASCEVNLLASEAKIAYPEGNPQKIPGIINITYYDQGGEGVGYHDLTITNDGDGIRKDQGVDTEFRLPKGTIGGIKSSEWLEYTVEVLQDGNYTFDIQFATAGRYGKFHLEFDGVDKTGSISVLTTGGYSKFATTKITGIALKKGIQVMRIFFDFAEYNLGTISVNREIPSGMNLPETAKKITIFPTPTYDNLFISGINIPEKYSILNVYGQVLLQGKIADNEAIDVKFLKSGNYLIRFKNIHEVQTEKFIKL